MRIFNKEKTMEIVNPDMTKGFLKQDRLLLEVKEEKQEVPEQTHKQLVATYPNGGEDWDIVVDVPYQPKQERQEVYEDIFVYIPFDQKQRAQQEITSHKAWFANTYTYKEQKYRRLKDMGFLDDDGTNPSDNLKLLYMEAENRRKEIQRLEKQVD